MRVGGKKGVGENYVRLRKMGIQIRLLHATIFDIKGARFRETKIYTAKKEKNIIIGMEGKRWQMRNSGGNVIKMLREREDIQWQIIESKIREARYNNKYRDLKLGNETPKYLLKENTDNSKIGKEIRALIRLRCGNMEESNKY